MKIVRKFLSVLIMAVMLGGGTFNAIAATSNLPMPDIGDNGVWATENNKNLFTTQITQDIENFHQNAQTQLVKDYVPIEAKVGLAFMNALAHVSNILDSSLVRFVILFMFIAYAFWVMFETYNMMTNGKGDVRGLVKNIFKKGLLIAVWVVVLRFGPAKIFMWIMGPVVSVGTYVADFILNAVVSVVGTNIPDTCGAIHAYATEHTSVNNIIDAAGAADMLCLPTRLSGFAYTAIAAGWKWMVAGIGHSAFTFIGGLMLVVMFLMIAWKFAFIALGVIADLFLGVMMLPFTAIKETIGGTSYKGMAGGIFNDFLKIFNTESLAGQINRFVQAALYFVMLGIVIAFCVAMLSGVIDANLATKIPTIDGGDFWSIMLVVGLTWWFANRATELVKKLSSDASINSSVGNQMEKDTTNLWDKISGTAKDWWKKNREKK